MSAPKTSTGHRRRHTRTLLVVVLLLGIVAAAFPAADARAALPPDPPFPTLPQFSAFPSHTDRWMAEYGDVIGQRPITSVVLPGTHDSATASLELWPTTMQSGSEYDTLRGWLWLLGPTVRGWSAAQDRSVLEQLNDGIRYLDLRYCWDSNTSRIRVCHGVFGEDLAETFRQVAAFLDVPGHDREILVIQVADVDLGTADRRNAMWGTIMDELGDRRVADAPSADGPAASDRQRPVGQASAGDPPLREQLHRAMLEGVGQGQVGPRAVEVVLDVVRVLDPPRRQVARRSGDDR